MFCDQDDIWLERKIEICVNYATQNFTQSTPNLLYCNGYIYSNTSSAIEASSFIHLHAKTLADFLFLNSGYHGCCLLFDKNLLNIAREYHGELNLHDNIICLLAYTFGAVHYLNKSLMLYRQHPSNFTEQVRKVSGKLYKSSLTEIKVLLHRITILRISKFLAIIKPECLSQLSIYLTLTSLFHN